MKLISYNVNGIRAIIQKNKDGEKDISTSSNVLNILDIEESPDIICIQETKCNTIIDTLPQYPYQYFKFASTRKGYSGVAVFSKEKPIKELNDFLHNEEGRLICLEYTHFYLINTYTPNTKPDLSRLDYRVNTWEFAIREYINKLQEHKPVILGSDFNVAHTELDIHTIKGMNRTHGFTIEERNAYTQLLNDCNLIDTFRMLHPKEKVYSWYSYLGKSRSKNKGWRIDGFLVNICFTSLIKRAEILNDFKASDHSPVLLEISL